MNMRARNHETKVRSPLNLPIYNAIDKVWEAPQRRSPMAKTIPRFRPRVPSPDECTVIA